MPSSPSPVLDEIRSVPQRGTRSGSKPAIPAPPPALAIRIPVRVAGLVLLGIVAVCLVALASWSVDDPSFSYATTKTPANWLGFPGAVIADTLFQVFGLGALILLVPPALWGWTFSRRRMPTSLGLRFIGWVGATLLGAGVLSFVAMPASWPLPTGLGGLIGTGFTTVATMVTGEQPQAVTAALFAIIIAIPAFALFWIAMGLGNSVPTGPNKARAAAAGRKGAVAEPADADEPETNPIVDVALGAMVHMGYSLRTAFRRARASHAERRAADAASWRDDDVEPSLDGGPAGERREPMVAATQRRIHAPVEPGMEPTFERAAEPEISPRINARPSYDDTELDYPDEPQDDDMPFVADLPVPAASHRQQGDSRLGRINRM